MLGLMKPPDCPAEYCTAKHEKSNKIDQKEKKLAKAKQKQPTLNKANKKETQNNARTKKNSREDKKQNLNMIIVLTTKNIFNIKQSQQKGNKKQCLNKKKKKKDNRETRTIYILRRMGKNKALAHHTSAYFPTRRVSI